MSRLKRKLWLVCLTVLASTGALLAFHTLLVLEPNPPSRLALLRPIERDLPEIAEDGVLRVAMCTDEVAYSEVGGRRRGLAHDLAFRLTSRLGVQLEPVIVSNPAAGLREVMRGGADVFAVIDPGPLPVFDKVAWTGAFESSEPVVVGTDAAGIRAVGDLRGRTVAVPLHSAFEKVVLRWQAQLGGDLKIERLPSVLNAREIVEGVARGSFPLVVMDRDRALLETAFFDHVGASARLGDPLPVRWAVRPNAPQLARVATRVLDELRVSGVLAELEQAYLENPVRLRELRRARTIPGDHQLSPWDDLFQEAAHEHGLDWRLVAALSRTESGHDPLGVGPGGSAGLLQLMPATARAFGADDPFDPRQNVAAGTRHLRWLNNVLRDVQEECRLAFVLAAYNMGLAHVEDARKLAAERGLDPDRWDGHVATMLPLLEDPEISRTLEHGRARGSFTLGYVRRVLSLYRSYTGEVEPTRTAQVDDKKDS